MKFPYFGKFSYYAIFSKNNTILDIRVPFKAFKRRKKILHVRYFILRHLHLIIKKKDRKLNISSFLLIFVKIWYFDQIFWGSNFIFKCLLMHCIYSIHHYTKYEYINRFLKNSLIIFFFRYFFFILEKIHIFLKKTSI